MNRSLLWRSEEKYTYCTVYEKIVDFANVKKGGRDPDLAYLYLKRAPSISVTFSEHIL
jgi:hypothetical protein